MLRNREIRRALAVWLLITIAAVASGFAVHPAAAGLLLVSAAAYGIAFFVFVRARYQKLARMSEQIDQVLHNADRLYISDEKEGELSILQSEIAKMTLRIREQNAALKREKEHLAESLADIAHQLRTPLTSAALILSLLEHQPESKERKELLRELEELFAQMDWLLTALLKLSRLDAGIVEFQMEEVAVSRLIEAALSPLQIAMELHNVCLRCELSQDASLVADMRWLSEAICNILKNCLDSVGDDGVIEIVCENTLLYTEIRIHDSGAGFAKDDIPRLFERYYRGKHAGAAGYGIGLALSKTIIMGQGGTIAARNHPQGGALFTLRFSRDRAYHTIL